MEQAKVFISSVLDVTKEDLIQERNAARQVADSYPFLTAWVFEKAPASPKDLEGSYLDEVDAADLFVLIVGQKATEPVIKECLRARACQIPTLVFVKTVDQRERSVADLLKLLGTKYASFADVEELRAALKCAIEQTIVQGIRSIKESSLIIPEAAILRRLAEEGQVVHVRPIIPAHHSDEFTVASVDGDVVILHKVSCGQDVRVPLQRVDEILPPTSDPLPMIRLQGRIQWITTKARWIFLEEEPDPDSPLGFSKPQYNSDYALQRIQAELSDHEFRLCNLGKIPESRAKGWEVVYDEEDGRYFCVGESIFMHRKRE